jgi:hypothetical protein
MEAGEYDFQTYSNGLADFHSKPRSAFPTSPQSTHAKQKTFMSSPKYSFVYQWKTSSSHYGMPGNCLQGSLPASVVDLAKAQGDLALASQLHVLADGMRKKLATETSKLATLTADADGSLKKSCQLLGDDVPGCVASKLKSQQSSIDGFKATLKGMVEFEQTLNHGILSTFAKNADKTCTILAKTASDVAAQVSTLTPLNSLRRKQGGRYCDLHAFRYNVTCSNVLIRRSACP